MAARRLPLRKKREQSHLQGEESEGWSDWKMAIVPSIFPLIVEGRNLELRGPNQVGFICSSIRNAFPDEANCCGIYEWSADGTLLDKPDHVVYVGSTCRGKPGALRGRILEYCRDGSHNEHLMNDALRSRGYGLWVRVKTVEGSHPSRKDAEDMENDLLDRYDYAWNITNNRRMRDILP